MLRVSRLPVIVLIGAAALWAAAWGAASGLALYGDAIARSAGGDPVRLARALRVYEGAARLDGLDPDYFRRRARMLESLADAEPIASEQSLERLTAALALYRESVARRPTWPYASVDVARVQLKLGNLDAELTGYLRWAWRCGAWSPWVQRELLGIGLAAWPLLDADTRVFFEGVLDRVLREQPRAALDLALDLGRRELVERHIEGNERLQALLKAQERRRRASGR